MLHHNLKQIYISTSYDHKLFLQILEPLTQVKTNILFLHGGPGSGCHDFHIEFFSQFSNCRIFLLDQRGAGKSTPHACIKDNNIDLLTYDIELIRKKFNINKWLIVGGSWGSTLALYYYSLFSSSCQALVLYGIFMGSKDEINNFYEKSGTGDLFFPDIFSKFTLGNNNIDSYYKYFQNYNKNNFIYKTQSEPSIWNWTKYELSLSRIFKSSNEQKEFLNKQKTNKSYIYAHSIIENHFFFNNCFLQKNQLNKQLHKVYYHIPISLINGRYDMITPPITAYRLKKTIGLSCKLTIIENAGHTLSQANIIKIMSHEIKTLSCK